MTLLHVFLFCSDINLLVYLFIFLSIYSFIYLFIYLFFSIFLSFHYEEHIKVASHLPDFMTAHCNYC